MPAIVIRDHRHRGVANLRFARELGLGQIRHSNHFKTQLAIHMGFGQRGKLRPFHANVRAAPVDAHFGKIARGAENSGNLRADRLVKAHMRNHAIAKKCGDPVTRAIVELVRNQKIERLQIFLQGADGAHGNNSLDAQLLHRVNVGEVIDLRWEEAVPARVPSKKGDTLSLERSHDESVGWISKRRLDAHFARFLKPRHIVEAAAADNANANRLRARAAPLCCLRLPCHSDVLLYKQI